MDPQISPAPLGHTLCGVENPPKGPGPQRDVGDLVRKRRGAPGENGWWRRAKRELTWAGLGLYGGGQGWGVGTGEGGQGF